MGKRDPRVDAYIGKSAPFARPILRRLRTLIHAGCPDVEETLKWSHVAFMHEGILCGLAAFKAHCAFSFWRDALLRKEAPGAAVALDRLGRMETASDLPPDRVILSLVRRAVALHDRGEKLPARARTTGRQELKVPAYFMTALRKNPAALAIFKGLSYSHRKEYVEWVTEAKTEPTRQRRLETAVAWMSEGRVRNWKYVRG